MRSCQPRSTLSFRSTWTSPSWWRATSLTCASTSSSLPATHFVFFSTTTAWFAWAPKSTMHPVRPTWWVTDNNTVNDSENNSLYLCSISQSKVTKRFTVAGHTHWNTHTIVDTCLVTSNNTCIFIYVPSAQKVSLMSCRCTHNCSRIYNRKYIQYLVCGQSGE